MKICLMRITPEISYALLVIETILSNHFVFEHVKISLQNADI